MRPTSRGAGSIVQWPNGGEAVKRRRWQKKHVCKAESLDGNDCWGVETVNARDAMASGIATCAGRSWCWLGEALSQSEVRLIEAHSCSCPPHGRWIALFRLRGRFRLTAWLPCSFPTCTSSHRPRWEGNPPLRARQSRMLCSNNTQLDILDYSDAYLLAVRRPLNACRCM